MEVQMPTNPITGEEIETAEDLVIEAAFHMTDLALTAGITLRELVGIVIGQYAVSVKDMRAGVSTFEGQGNPEVHPVPNWLCNDQRY